MKTTDSTGAVVNDPCPAVVSLETAKGFTYDVYGNVTSSSGAQANEFQFAGEQTDPTGLQYLRARYYDTASGTFISRDPLSSGVGYSGHPFGYVDGNPANLVDPSGTLGIFPPINPTCWFLDCDRDGEPQQCSFSRFQETPDGGSRAGCVARPGDELIVNSCAVSCGLAVLSGEYIEILFPISAIGMELNDPRAGLPVSMLMS